MKLARILFILFSAAALGAALYYLRIPLGGLFFPCQSPIGYSIGAFDTRFGLTKKQFSAEIAKAAAIWEGPIHKNLFEESQNGALTINLVYDFRQQATERLTELGIVIHSDEKSYNDLKSRYSSYLATYSQGKEVLNADVARFNSEKIAYEAEVAYWNSHGGAPKEKFAELNEKKAVLQADAERINQAQAKLNELVVTLNALVDVMNKLASELNLNATRYNTIGDQRGGEFEEGVYRYDALHREIDIYQFDNEDRLVRVLAHELGHALGLAHLENPKAIMYRLNQGVNEKLTADDLSALKAHCGIK